MFAKTAVCLAIATMATALQLGQVTTLNCKPNESAMIDMAEWNECKCVNNAWMRASYTTGPNCVSVALKPASTRRCSPNQVAIIDSAQNNNCRCVSASIAGDKNFSVDTAVCKSVPLNAACKAVWSDYGIAMKKLGQAAVYATYTEKGCAVANCMPKASCPLGSASNPNPTTALVQLGDSSTVRCKPNQKAIVDKAQEKWDGSGMGRCRCVTATLESPTFFVDSAVCSAANLNKKCQAVWDEFDAAKTAGKASTAVDQKPFLDRGCAIARCLPKQQCPAGSVGNP